MLGVCALEFAHEACKNTIRESALKVDRTKGEGAREGGGSGEASFTAQGIGLIRHGYLPTPLYIQIAASQSIIVNRLGLAVRR